MKHRIVYAAVVSAALLSGAASAAAGQNTKDDPFFREPKKVTVPVSKDADKPVLLPFPPLEQRMQEYVSAKQSARASGRSEPNPIGQYLVSELTVTGVFQTDRGVGAFVVANPTQTTFFVAPGTRVYNGEIVTINTGSNFSQGQVVFRELTKYTIKKKTQEVINTVTKPVTSGTGK
jgi:hypothetical protein